ncbi:MAG TPA: hypothetical protein VF617_12590 [Sphingomonas sp.]
MGETTLRQKLYALGCRVSDVGANIAGHPVALIGVLLFCCGWFLLPLGDTATAVLTLVLSVMAITLTQMVLNQQKRHESRAPPQDRRADPCHARRARRGDGSRGKEREGAGGIAAAR